MDRAIVYNGEELLETDFLNGQKFAMVGLAKLAAAVLGSGPLLNSLPCTPGSGLTVQVGAGEIYQSAQVDATAFSSLGADTHQILKQGILADAVTLNCPAPGTAGQSINYLVQVEYQDTDTGSTVLPFYNASNPSQVYQGPGGNGQPSMTVRSGQCVVQVKAGTAAATGTQTTPAPDSGFVGAYVVTVANGASSISSGNISVYSGAPFLISKLGNLIQVYSGNPNGHLAGTAGVIGVSAPSLAWDTASGTLWTCTTTGTTSSAVWSRLSLMQVYAGNPNGNVAGSAGTAGGASPSMIWDVTNNVLWVCTTTGNAAAAVWSEVGIGSVGAFPFWCGTSTGSANAQTVVPPPAMQSFGVGTGVTFIAGYTNNGAATLTVGTFGTYPLRKDGPSGLAALTGNEIIAGEVISGRFDGTYIQVSAIVLGALAYENIGQGLEDDGSGSLRVKLADNSLRRTASGIQIASAISRPSGATSVTAANNGALYVPTTAVTLTVTQSTNLFNGFGFSVDARNGAVTVTPNAADSINGNTAGISYTVLQGTSADFVCDGAGNIEVLYQSSPPGSLVYLNAAATIGAGQYEVDTSAASVPLVFSAGIAGSVIRLIDINGTWRTNAVTLTPGSGTIMGTTSYPLNSHGADVMFRWNTSTNDWRLV